MVENKNADILLDEDFLRKLEKLKLLIRKGAKGPFRGEHISWRSGTSLEFMDYRKYQAGDDFRYVDWNVFGRLDKLFIKLFRSEEDLIIHILIDMSRSMEIGNPPKELYAKKIAAALSYICLANLDKVTVTSFSDSLHKPCSPERGKKVYISILNYLNSVRPNGITRLNSCLAEYATAFRRPGAAVVISDFMDPYGFRNGLEALRYAGFNVTLIHILDHQELFPILDGYLQLEEIETNETRKITLDKSILEAYKEKITLFIRDIKELCGKNRIDYYLTDTSIPVEEFLLYFLK
jgi:uncharacterized protein (DUF58 family)